MVNKNEDTSHFYLDGMGQQNFFDRFQKPKLIIDEVFLLEREIEMMLGITKVDILRSLLFFHAEQKSITLADLKKYFRSHALAKLEKDGFIRIVRIEKQE